MVYIEIFITILINSNELTSWRYWNDAECIGESSPNGRKF